MTNVASRYFGLMLLIATTVSGVAQSNPVDDAVKEAIRREHEKVLLNQKLTEANEAAGRRDLPTAMRLYEEAYTSVGKIGGGDTGPAADQTRRGLVAVRLELAQQAAKRGDLQEVKTQTDRVLL